MALKKKTTKTAKAAKKPVARKATKVVKTRTTAKKTVAAKASTKTTATSFPSAPITQKLSKAQIFAEMADMTGFSKNDIKTFFSAQRNLVERNIKGKGFGKFVIPELAIKVTRVHKTATKAKMGRNPFTGEEIQIPAKPARKSVKATALKALKALA